MDFDNNFFFSWPNHTCTCIHYPFTFEYILINPYIYNCTQNLTQGGHNIGSLLLFGAHSACQPITMVILVQSDRALLDNALAKQCF